MSPIIEVLKHHTFGDKTTLTDTLHDDYITNRHWSTKGPTRNSYRHALWLRTDPQFLTKWVLQTVRS